MFFGSYYGRAEHYFGNTAVSTQVAATLRENRQEQDTQISTKA